jgi:hypothetical protein
MLLDLVEYPQSHCFRQPANPADIDRTGWDDLGI